MNALKIIVLVFISSQVLWCQEMEPIQTDRPDQTETPSLIPKNYLQIETGFSYEKDKFQNTIYTIPSTLWKYGVNERFELRLITEFTGAKNVDNITEFGLLPITVGIKTSLAEESGIWPKISLLGHLSLSALASENFKATFFAPAFRFTFQNSLTDRLSVGYNLGAEWDGESPQTIFIYTLALGYSWTEKLASYIELFGFAPEGNKMDHRLDFGLSYLIHPNYLVDLSSGVGISNSELKYYIATGFSFRFNTSTK
ncbi:MAG: transporter [Bacteroidota bacterium]|nr:transporter [Bacteroidota bacterium]